MKESHLTVLFMFKLYTSKRLEEMNESTWKWLNCRPFVDRIKTVRFYLFKEQKLNEFNHLQKQQVRMHKHNFAVLPKKSRFSSFNWIWVASDIGVVQQANRIRPQTASNRFKIHWEFNFKPIQFPIDV